MIPESIKAQIADRIELLNSMIDHGAIGIPWGSEFFSMPIAILSSTPDAALDSLYKELMKTRKRAIQFVLNARMYIVPRKIAIELVKNERNIRVVDIRKR